MKKRFILLLLLIALFPIYSYANLSLIDTENISKAVVKNHYSYEGKKGKARVYILKCNLSDKDFGIDIITGKEKYTRRATVSEMGDIRNTLANVNGDFFNMALQGVPEGPSMRNGKLLSSPSVITDVYSLAITNDMKADILKIWSQGGVTAPNGKKYPISGLNKSYYWYDTTNEYSHENKINMYDDMWASKSRGDKKNAEVILSNDYTVEQISDKNFSFSVPDGKYILQLDGLAKEFFDQNIEIGDKLKIDYTIYPRNDYKMLIGAHGILVENGKAKSYTKDVNVLGGFRARTAAGISKDGNTLYILSAEGRTKRSVGLSLNDMSKIFVELGCFKAVNLDGGGSTAMVAKALGENERTRFVNPERNAPERRVVNGIGIFNNAKPTGVVAGVKISGPDTLFVGETGKYSLKSAWDTNYLPMDIKGIGYSVYDLNGEETAWNKNNFTPTKVGPCDIGLTTSEGTSTVKPIEVLGLDKLKGLNIERDKFKVNIGDVINVKISGVKPDRNSFSLNPMIFKVTSDTSKITNLGSGKLRVDAMNSKISKISFSGAGKNEDIIIASSDADILKMTVSKNEWEMDGKISNMEVSPFIKNNRTLVPIRFIVEALNGNVDWNPDSMTATISLGGKIIEIPINSNKVKVDGIEKTIDSSAIISNSRTFVPIRFISETIGLEVIYLDKTREIYILDSKNTLKEPSLVEENVENPEKMNQNKNENKNKNLVNQKNINSKNNKSEQNEEVKNQK